MICCQFIFKPGTYDDDFRRLDGEIDDYARSLAGFDRVEKWLSPEGDVVNAMYYFADPKSVAMLGRFPQHREATGQVARWYDGYPGEPGVQIVRGLGIGASRSASRGAGS